MRLLVPLAAVLLLVLAACTHVAPPAPVPVAGPPGAPEPSLPMHNVHWVSPKLISGAEPVTAADFRALQAAGVKTIISVDGATPNVALAATHGMHYVHIPYGYDGVPRDAAIKLASAYAQTSDRMYIHCHHGLHRGPAGAATALVCTGAMTPVAATALMQQIGTGKEYAGLYRDVQQAQPVAPVDYVPLAQLPSIVAVDDLAQVMSKMDRTWDQLQALKAAGYATPGTDGPQAALLVKETFRELARRPDIAARPADFRTKLATAEAAATALEAGLRHAEPPAKLLDLHKQLAQSCSACHVQYRN